MRPMQKNRIARPVMTRVKTFLWKTGFEQGLEGWMGKDSGKMEENG